MTIKSGSLEPQASRTRLAEMLKAIGHPVRLRIVEEIARRHSCCCGEMCDCFPLSQSTVSQHLSVLKNAGIVAVEKKGTSSRYSLDAEALRALQDDLNDLMEFTRGCCNDR